MATKFYAVKKGHKTGIFNSWEECKASVSGYSGAIYKSFKHLEDAEKFVHSNNLNILVDTVQLPPSNNDIIDIFIDGSYDKDKKLYSCGVIILTNPQIEFKKADNNPEYICMRNVSGELMGAFYALKWIIKNKDKYSKFVINYDYEGIERWATGDWKAKNILTQKYSNYFKEISPHLNIEFKKVKAHSGDKYNEQVDKLAKQAIIEFIDKSNIDQSNNENLAAELEKTSISNGRIGATQLNIIIDYKNITLNNIQKEFKLRWKKKKKTLKEIKSLYISLDYQKKSIIFSGHTMNNEELYEVISLEEMLNV